MRRAFGMLLLLSLPCCDTLEPELESEPPAFGITARIDPGGLSDVIVVSSTDWRPLRSAVLVVSGGAGVPAYSLDVAASPTDIGPPAAAILLVTPGWPRTVTQLKALVSTALIRLPDPDRYAKGWQNSRIEVVLGDADAGREAMILAAPPPM
jgi:hypothetical protein